LFMALGAGVGLLSVSTLVCDFVLQHFLPQSTKYVEQKFEEITDPELQNIARTPTNTSRADYKAM